MSWPDDRVLSRGLHALLSLAHLGHLWTEDGPTDGAWSFYQKNGGPLSRGERTLLLAAFAIWNSKNRKASFAEVVQLDTRLEALLSFTLACGNGNEGVEAWIADAGARRERGPRTPMEHALLQAAIAHDPPGDDLMEWLIRWLPGAPTVTVINAYAHLLGGAYGAIEHVGGGNCKPYDFPNGTVITATPVRLVPRERGAEPATHANGGAS